MKFITTTLKKTVTSIHDMLDPLGLNRNKPRFLYAGKIAMSDPAGSPRTNVYRRDVTLISGPAH